MAHHNIYDPGTNKWACWSTVVDDYVSHWLPENEYKSLVLEDALAQYIQYSAISHNPDFISSVVNADNSCTITIKDITKVGLKNSDIYCKEECDEILAEKEKRILQDLNTIAAEVGIE